jgi:aldose 1-epimerase
MTQETWSSSEDPETGLAMLSTMSDDIELTVLPELGARLHRLSAFGQSLLRTPAGLRSHIHEPFYWGAYHMAPWCNRLSTSPMSFAGTPLELKPNFPDGTAIHGQVFTSRWRLLPSGEFITEGGGDDWPWRYSLTLEISVQGQQVELQNQLTNESASPMPAGLGIHPWFTEQLRLRVPSSHVFPSNGEIADVPQEASAHLDLREARQLDPDIDATWVELDEPYITLTWPDRGVEASIRVDTRCPVVVAASPEGLDAVAIEPQSHAPQGLRRLLQAEPYGLETLEPGEPLRFALRIDFREIND